MNEGAEPMGDRIKVLFLAADPFRDRARLELEGEVRAVRNALQRGRARDTLELEAHFGTRTRDLQFALLDYEPDIVHFSGHGGRDGVLYLADAQGKPMAVGKDALAKLFEALDGGVRAVVLNACHTHSIVEALRDTVDYAIGTNREISDERAIDFSRAFYTALAAGADVQKAFDLGVSQLELDGSDESTVPMLRKRFGADRTPLLAAAKEQGASSGGGIRQDLHFGDISGSRMRVTGEEGPGGGTGAPVTQNVRSGNIHDSDMSFAGRGHGPTGG
jgi:hypothetical protein